MTKKCITPNKLGLPSTMVPSTLIIIELMQLFQILFLEMIGVYFIGIPWKKILIYLFKARGF